MFRSAKNHGPSTAASGSRSAHQPVPETVSQSTNHASSSYTYAAPTFQRPRRFLLLAREKLEPANSPATSTARGDSRPRSRLVDSIELDLTPPEPASRHSQQTMPQPREESNPSPAKHAIASTSSLSSRSVQRPVPQSKGSLDVGRVDTYAASSSTSRVTQRPISRPERSTGPSGVESGIVPSASINRGSRPFPLAGMRNPGSTTTPIPASHAAYQHALQSNCRAEPVRTPVGSASRVAQQSTPQPTRHTLPAHMPTPSTSNTAQRPRFQLPRTSSALAPPASSSRATQQSTIRSMRATTAPSNTPGSSASAPILEFICLYTHDLRRKKKRWQDGKLKFHTFNKKYMVYDDDGGFVGDGHWQGDESEVAEGLEMNLDRGMAIVQLLECTGSKEQDLGEVLGKRVREVEERRVSAAARVASSTAPQNPAKRSRAVAVVVEAPPPTIATTMTIPLPPENEEAPPTTATTMIPLPPRIAGAPPKTARTMIPLPPSNGGAWSTHAMDLLGMTRPRRG